jgi:hypothetical protein
MRTVLSLSLAAALLIPTASMAFASDAKDAAQAKPVAHHISSSAKKAPAKHLKGKAKASTASPGRATK